MSNFRVTPHLTEKSLALVKKGEYTFLVSGKADKTSITSAIRTLYSVHPKAVRLVKNAPKKKGLQRPRFRPGRIKAIITLKGEKIADFAVDSAKQKESSPTKTQEKKS